MVFDWANAMIDGTEISKDIEHVIISMLDSGLSIFHHSFVEQNIEPDLFSAIITASSLQQKMGRMPDNPLLQEQYEVENYIAHVVYGEYLAGIIVTSIGVSQTLLTRFLKFLALFEEEHKFILTKWHGDRSFFDQDWAYDQLVQHLVPASEGFILSSEAMRKAENAKQIRLVQLIKRFVKRDSFTEDTLIDIIEDNLMITKDEAKAYVKELIESEIFKQPQIEDMEDVLR